MNIPSDVQVVKSATDSEPCRACGRDIADVGNFRCTGSFENSAMSRREYFQCKCGNIFAIDYRFFDPDGHINSLVFTGDCNSPEFDFFEFLTHEQKQLIMNHYNTCKVCQGRRDETMMTDALFADWIHRLRQAGIRSTENNS